MSRVLKPTIAFGPRKNTPPVSLSELYHENTKLHPSTPPEPGNAQSESYSTSEIRAMSKAFKQYPSASRIPLPRVESMQASERSFDEVIASRRSVRNFTDAELTLDDFSRILYQSYGITGEMTLPIGQTQCLRAAPSAGAIYPAEIYLGIRRVTGVEPGVYHYNVKNHELELLIHGDLTQDLSQICGRQEYVSKAAVVILISAVFQRTKRKYGERGYRYALLDVGHLGQNIYLACTALGISVMTTCGFFDDEANKLLRLDGVDETMLYVAFIGK